MLKATRVTVVGKGSSDVSKIINIKDLPSVQEFISSHNRCTSRVVVLGSGPSSECLVGHQIDADVISTNFHHYESCHPARTIFVAADAVRLMSDADVISPIIIRASICDVNDRVKSKAYRWDAGRSDGRDDKLWFNDFAGTASINLAINLGYSDIYLIGIHTPTQEMCAEHEEYNRYRNDLAYLASMALRCGVSIYRADYDPRIVKEVVHE